MSLKAGCNNIINKYSLEQADGVFLLDELYKECEQNHEQNCIDQDTIEQYERISDWLVNYVNTNNLHDLKKELKEAFNPLKTDGFIKAPDNLYTSDEKIQHTRQMKQRNLEYTKLMTDDEPSEPAQRHTWFISSDEEET
jgi:hypothetical protein